MFYGGSDGLKAGEIGGTTEKELATRSDSIEDVAMDEDGIVMVTTDRDGHLDAWGVTQ